MKQSEKSMEYFKRLHFELTELLETLQYFQDYPIGSEFSEEDLATLDKKIDSATHLNYEYWKLGQPDPMERSIPVDPVDSTFKPLVDLFNDMMKDQTRERIFLKILQLVDNGYKEEQIEIQFSEIIAKSMAYTDKVIELYFSKKEEEPS